MSEVLPLLGDYVPKRFTIADLEHLPSQLPSGPVRYELHHGRLITLPACDDWHGAAVARFAGELMEQGQHRGLGKARCGGVGLILGRDPDHLFGVDVLFISNSRLPIRRSPEDYLETMPELVVEVCGLSERPAGLARKAADYLQAGAVCVWVADPFRRNVVEYRDGVEPRTYGEDETLTCEDIIPGFRLDVRMALAE
jgi:Uma2 family endonuclease